MILYFLCDNNNVEWSAHRGIVFVCLAFETNYSLPIIVPIVFSRFCVNTTTITGIESRLFLFFRDENLSIVTLYKKRKKQT